MREGPISPDVENGLRGGALPAHVANGLVGLRIREVPLLARSAIVGGVVGLHPEQRKGGAFLLVPASNFDSDS